MTVNVVSPHGCAVVDRCVHAAVSKSLNSLDVATIVTINRLQIAFCERRQGTSSLCVLIKSSCPGSISDLKLPFKYQNSLFMFTGLSCSQKSVANLPSCISSTPPLIGGCEAQ